MKNKKIIYYILAFLIPFLIVNIVFMRLGVSYFGDKNVLISDMEAQYISLFNYFKNIFNGTESIFYSFNSGLGNAMMGTFAYYLASPLNLILLLFSSENLCSGVLLLVTLKIALSGLTMYIYLNRKINGKKIFTLMFSCMYALMAFNINNYFNVMWLDGIFLAPLVLLGIDRILEGKSSLFFGITLFITIISNYYIGYMVCIFSCLYILYEILLRYKKEDKKDLLKKFIRFALTGILVGLMTSFLILPGIAELSVSSKSTHSIFNQSWSMRNNLLDIFSKTFIGSHNLSNILNYKTPNLYCGLIIIPLVFFYFINKKIDKKEKIFSSIIILIFIISIVFDPINMIWHGLSLPQGFNYRFTFLFCLFLIYISYKSFNNLKEIKLKNYIIFFIIYILLSLLVIFKIDIFYDKIFIYVSIGIILIYLLILKNVEKNLNIILILMISAELFFNMYTSLDDYSYSSKEIYDNNLSNVKNMVGEYKANDNEFYRIEKNYTYTLNDSLLLSYKGVNHFLSTANGGVIKFAHNVGLTGRNLNLNYLNSTKVIDTLFGIKYIFSFEEIVNYQLLEDKDAYIYQNNDALNLGYMVSNNVKKYKEKKYNDYFLYQNYVIDLMTNTKNLYKKVDVIKDDNSYKFDCSYETDYIYVLINRDDYDGTIEMRADDSIIKLIEKDIYLIKLPYNLKDKTYNFKLMKDKKMSDITPNIKAYVLNDELYNSVINKLKDEQFEVKKTSNTKISGEIKVNEEGALFLTIPYDSNFEIKVDGKKIKYDKIFNSFIGIDLKVGRHNIEIEYKTKYLKEGIIISITSFIILSLYIIYQKKRKLIDNSK